MEDISKDEWLNFRIDGDSEEIIKIVVVPILTDDENKKCYKGVHFGQYNKPAKQLKCVRVWSRGESEKLEWLYTVIEKECKKHGYRINGKEINVKPDRKNFPNTLEGDQQWQYHIMLLELGSELAFKYYEKFGTDIPKIPPELIWKGAHFFLNNVSYTYADEIVIFELISCNAKIGLMKKQV